MPSIVHAVQESDGTWSVYTWDGEPLNEGLTEAQARAQVDRTEDRRGNWEPAEWADDPRYDDWY